jgi:exodeoxyribonuclease-1
MSLEFLSVVNKCTQVKASDAEALYLDMSDAYKKWVSRDAFVDYVSSHKKESILWHDYEAGGTHGPSVAPLQFAGLRTDMLHRLIDVPMDIYCKLAGDKLPHPEAIAITKISPLECYLNGLPEPVFFRSIEKEMSQPGTCVAGYNSYGYDEEVTRFGFWRNLLPVYEREYANFNSRLDLLKFTAAFSASNVGGIEWHIKEDGNRSLKLEHIAQSNNITQENAHNAIDDVKALIDISRMLQQKSPQLWDYCFNLRRKKAVQSVLYPGAVGILADVKLGAKNGFCAPVLVIGTVIGEGNKVVVVNLSEMEALRSCWKLDVPTIQERMYAKKEVLETNCLHRPPLQTMALNKAPSFFPQATSQEYFPGMLTEDLKEVAARVMASREFVQKIIAAASGDDFATPSNPEMALYGAGFPSGKDANLIKILKGQTIQDAFTNPPEWENPSYQILWERCRAKLEGYDGLELQPSEKKAWNTRRKNALSNNTDTPDKHNPVEINALDGLITKSLCGTQLGLDYNAWIKELISDIS